MAAHFAGVPFHVVNKDYYGHLVPPVTAGKLTLQVAADHSLFIRLICIRELPLHLLPPVDIHCKRLLPASVTDV